MAVYDLLFALSDTALEGYREDLEKHDREAIEANPGVPFLHWTRKNGTHITFLSGADSYLAAGVYVPYLFGTADRRSILDQKSSVAEHFLNPCNPKAKIVLYYDGAKLRRITAEKALEIAKTYQRRIADGWRTNKRGMDTLAPSHCYC